MPRKGKCPAKIFLVLAFLSGRCVGQSFTNPLWIPDTLLGPVFNLTIDEGEKQFLPGSITPTKRFNSASYLGPTLIMKRGWQIETTVQNNLADTTTLHWHGIHLSSHADGGPHSPILPGAQWNPHFTCLDKAGTYWYHPHFHGKTGQHTMEGAAGMILVRDQEEAQLALPRRYGVDDFPLIIQSQEFGPDHHIKPKGTQDSIVLVNGTTSSYLEVPAQMVRLRLLNASNARNFLIGLPNDDTLYLIGTDCGLLGASVSLTRLKLAPGERAEILVNFLGKAGQTIRLISYASEILQGVQGGPTIIGPPGTPSQFSPLNGVNFDILEFRIAPMTANPVQDVPTQLALQSRLQESEATMERVIRFTPQELGSVSGPFLIDDSTFRMDRIDQRIPINNVEIWTLRNQTVVAHPFHLHGFPFYILDRYGAPVGPEEMGKKDMILLSPNEEARIIVRFADFADSLMPYMYHCHILTHEDEGMMAQFVVMPLISNTKGDLRNFETAVFPNPAGSYLQLKSPRSYKATTVEIRNVMGSLIRSIPYPDIDVIFIDDLKPGFYMLSFSDGEIVRFAKE